MTVTLIKSPTGFNATRATVVRSLGLRRIRHTVELKDTPACGMIHKVRHLVGGGVASLPEFRIGELNYQFEKSEFTN